MSRLKIELAHTLLFLYWSNISYYHCLNLEKFLVGSYSYTISLTLTFKILAKSHQHDRFFQVLGNTGEIQKTCPWCLFHLETRALKKKKDRREWSIEWAVFKLTVSRCRCSALIWPRDSNVAISAKLRHATFPPPSFLFHFSFSLQHVAVKYDAPVEGPAGRKEKSTV